MNKIDTRNQGVFNDMAAAEAQTFKLPAVIDLDEMDEVREWLVASTGQGNVRLDASGVERCATNALLMLVTAADTARRFGFTLKFAAPSASLRETIGRLGFNDVCTDMIEDE